MYEEIDLFKKYESMAEEAVTLYKEKKRSEEKFLENFLSLNEEYTKLTKKFNKVVKISDKQQNEILRINNELQEVSKDKEKLIRDLEDKNLQLKKYTSMKDKFLSVASHDLRTPFAAILAYTEFMLDGENLSDEHKEYLKVIQKSARIQLDYIKDILNIVKLETGDFDLKIDKSNYKECIEISIDLLNILAKKKDISIIYDTSKKIYSEKVYMDVPKITQVINNLIGNAIKFTGRGGVINIECVKNEENEIEFHCIDNGIGIPKNRQNLIFTHYNEFRTAGTENESGSGLGLAICKNIVNLHGGKIGFSSEANKGSDFYFSLPKNIKNKIND